MTRQDDGQYGGWLSAAQAHCLPGLVSRSRVRLVNLLSHLLNAQWRVGRTCSHPVVPLARSMDEEQIIDPAISIPRSGTLVVRMG